MYTFPDKSRNTHSNRSSKAFELKRWDHGGFDQIQAEQTATKYKNDDRGDNFKKQRKFQNDNTMASDGLSRPDQGNYYGASKKDKWEHDKYDEVTKNSQTEQKTQGINEKDKPQKPHRKERKPDRQLYSVRDKRGTQDDTKTRNGNQKETEGLEAKEKDMNNEEAAKGPRGSEKELPINEDDNKSSISNVSTAISDPLKGYEEETSILKESQNASMIKGLDKPKEIKKEQEEECLFEIVLDTEKREVVKIYENEEDYEAFLENLCMRHGIGKRMGLYFKINLLQIIQEIHPEPSKLDGILDKLLSVNYKLIIADEDKGDGRISPEVLPYMESDNNILDDMDFDLNQEEEEIQE